jgi:hypothetical protein
MRWHPVSARLRVPLKAAQAHGRSLSFEMTPGLWTNVFHFAGAEVRLSHDPYRREGLGLSDPLAPLLSTNASDLSRKTCSEISFFVKLSVALRISDELLAAIAGHR